MSARRAWRRPTSTSTTRHSERKWETQTSLRREPGGRRNSNGLNKYRRSPAASARETVALGSDSPATREGADAASSNYKNIRQTIRNKYKIKITLRYFKRPMAAGTSKFLSLYVLHLGRLHLWPDGNGMNSLARIGQDWRGSLKVLTLCRRGRSLKIVPVILLHTIVKDFCSFLLYNA